MRAPTLHADSASPSGPGGETAISGTVAPGFEEVRRVFEENFARRGDVGAACAVWWRGQPVVDLWGGVSDPRTRAPWMRDTMVIVFSTTKGMAATALAQAHSRGWFDWDDRVAEHWPEFAQAGKYAITVRQLLSHQAGLPALDATVDASLLGDAEAMDRVLARQRPRFEPGSRFAYHAITFGWYAGALLRHVDPAHRSLGRFFQEEIAGPLGVHFHIGTPPEEDGRVASVVDFRLRDGIRDPDGVPWRLAASLVAPWTLAAKALRNPRVANPSEFSSPAMRRFELPSTNGIGEVRAIARIYGDLATGGRALGIGPATLAALRATPPTPRFGLYDPVLGVDSCYSLGFMKPHRAFAWASAEGFGTPGLGGSFGFADPSRELGFAWAPNRLGAHLRDDPRERLLREAVLRAVDAMR